MTATPIGSAGARSSWARPSEGWSSVCVCVCAFVAVDLLLLAGVNQELIEAKSIQEFCLQCAVQFGQFAAVLRE